MIKRFSAVIPALIIVFTSIPVASAYADEQVSDNLIESQIDDQESVLSEPIQENYASEIKSGTCGDNLTWVLEKGTLTISGTGPMSDWSSKYKKVSPFASSSRIKKVIIQDGVTSIGDYCFYSCTSLKSISMPESMTRIGDGAFYSCWVLENVTIPPHVENIGICTFTDCYKISEIEIPYGIKEINESAFSGCSGLEKVILPEGVVSIGKRAFRGSKLKEIYLPNSLTSIGYEAFSCCYSLPSITIPDSVTEIGEFAFYDCYHLETFTIPNRITELSAGTFSHCLRLKEIILPDTLTEIGAGAFKDCRVLKSITLPSNISKIEESTFEDCKALTDITLYNNVISIDYDAFKNCTALTDVHYSGSESDWDSISINTRGTGNSMITYAAIHFFFAADGKYTVWFESNGGSAVTPVHIPRGGYIPEPASPTRKGYTFSGWYKDGTALSQIWDFEKDTVTGGIILHAKWVKGNSTDGSTALQDKDLVIAGNAVRIKWGFDHFKAETTHYEKNLAYAALYLSEKTEISKEEATKALLDLGFSVIDSKYYVGYENAHNVTAHSIGSREIELNGKKKLVVALVARGTQDLDEFISKDVYGGGFNGFLDAGHDTYDHLKQYIGSFDKYSNDDIILFLTGHSLGAAVAGQVARLAYNDGFPTSNTFVYTFASPNYEIENNDPATFKNVFNIVHDRDAVPTIPWGYKKIGKVVTYGEISGYLPHDSINVFDLKTHFIDAYFKCLKVGSRLDTTIDGKYAYIGCPVDIEVIDSDGNVVARTSGGSVTNYGPGNIIVTVNDDKKYVYSIGDAAYSIRFTGTGDGTMKYEVYSFNASTGDVISTKKYSNVQLKKDKTFTSNVIKDTNVKSIDLYVVDKKNNPTGKVAENGTETSIMPAYVVNQKIPLKELLGRNYKKYKLSSSKMGKIQKNTLILKKSGKLTVTGYTKKGKKWVTAKKITINVEKPKFKKKSFTLTKKGATLNVSKYLKTSTVKPVKWISSDSKVVKIDKTTGKVKAVKNGTAKISAVFGKGKKAVKYTVTIKVKNRK